MQGADRHGVDWDIYKTWKGVNDLKNKGKDCLMRLQEYQQKYGMSKYFKAKEKKKADLKRDEYFLQKGHSSLF